MDPFFGIIQDPLSLHKYKYCHGDGINFADPSGEFEGLAGLLNTMSIGVRDMGIRVSVGTQLFLETHVLIAKALFYSTAALTVLGAYADPGMTVAMGPNALAMDVQLVAAAAKQLGSLAKNGFAIIKEADQAGRAVGMFAALTRESVNSSKGSVASVNPAGWEDFCATVPSGERARSHLLGRLFGGPGNWKQNLVPMYQSANQRMYNEVEKMIVDKLNGGEFEKIYYTVTPKYNGDNPIPLGLTVEAVGENAAGDLTTILHRTVLNIP